MYGDVTDLPRLEWDWFTTRLGAAGSYWVTPADVAPHPRPVWGVWSEPILALSIGSPRIRTALDRPGAEAVVNLGSDTEVVIVEGRATGPTTDPSLVAAYDRKYDWNYDVEVYGPLTVFEPFDVVGWASAGWAGNGGFQAAGRFRSNGVGR